MGAIISAMLAIGATLGWSTQSLDGLEVFSGVASIFASFRAFGMAATGFDIENDIRQDI